MKRILKLAPAALLVAIVIFVFAAWVRYPGRAPVKLAVEQCDARLWNRVYEKDRLEVVEPCTAVEGRVKSVHFNEDGDVHIGLDPDQPSVLNLMNATHGGRELVVEIVCDHLPPRAPARATCAGYQPQVTPPKVGDRIRVTGAYVTDRDNGWREVHPVTRIEVLR